VDVVEIEALTNKYLKLTELSAQFEELGATIMFDNDLYLEQGLDWILSVFKKYNFAALFDLYDECKVQVGGTYIELNYKQEEHEFMTTLCWSILQTKPENCITVSVANYLIEKCVDCVYHCERQFGYIEKMPKYIKGSLVGFVSPEACVDGKGGYGYWIPINIAFVPPKLEYFRQPKQYYKHHNLTTTQLEKLIGCRFAINGRHADVLMKSSGGILSRKDLYLDTPRKISISIISNKARTRYYHCKFYAPKQNCVDIGKYPFYQRVKSEKDGDTIYRGTLDNYIEEKSKRWLEKHAKTTHTK